MKKLLILAIGILLVFSSFTVAEASLLKVTNEGEVEWNVLAIQDQIALGVPERNTLEVRDVAMGGPQNSPIILKRDGDKVFLNVGEGEAQKALDVTNWDEELVEVEERGEVKRIGVSVKEGRFIIEQNGILATTSYPISIDPEQNAISLVTDSGSIFLSILPTEAVETALRSRHITKVQRDTVELTEKETGLLTYVVSGERVIDVFRFMEYGVPVKTLVSASTGEVVAVDQPTWLRVFSFLLG